MGALTLTPQQQAVVENRGGSLLVSAAAGSGKSASAPSTPVAPSAPSAASAAAGE